MIEVRTTAQSARSSISLCVCVWGGVGGGVGRMHNYEIV